MCANANPACIQRHYSRAPLFLSLLPTPGILIRQVHILILFILNHDCPYGIFISYDGVLALLIPAETRFATEIICCRSLQRDVWQVKRLFVDEKYEAWHVRQNPKIREESRRMKALALSDDFWHINEVCHDQLPRNDHVISTRSPCNLHSISPHMISTRDQVFVAIEETAETSLRILDSDKPNLKDAAFAFKRIGQELNDPLLGRLASIKDWGQIDLCIDLRHRSHISPYHPIPCHAISHYTTPYHTITHHTIPYRTIPRHTIPYHTIPYHNLSGLSMWVTSSATSRQC